MVRSSGTTSIDILIGDAGLLEELEVLNEGLVGAVHACLDDPVRVGFEFLQHAPSDEPGEVVSSCLAPRAFLESAEPGADSLLGCQLLHVVVNPRSSSYTT